MSNPEHIRDILPRVVSHLGGTVSYENRCQGCGQEEGCETDGVLLAEAVRAYQVALNDPTYWTEGGQARNQQRVSETFDRMVVMATQILEDR